MRALDVSLDTYGEVLAVEHSLLTQLDVTQPQTSQKHTAQKDLKYNGPEHTSNTGDKCPDKAAQIEIVHFKK